MKIGYKKKRVTISAFSMCENSKASGGYENGTLYASESRNCDYSKGSLDRGIGLVPYYLDGNTIDFTTIYPQTHFFFLLQNKQEDGTWTKNFGFVSQKNILYAYDMETGGFRGKFTFEGEPKGVTAFDENGDQVLVIGDENGLYIYDQTHTVTKVEGVGKVKNIGYFGGRVFCANEQFELLYSAPFEPSDFSESIDRGGRIVLPSGKGGFEAIVPMKNKLFLFFERGIFELEGAGSARDFAVREISYNGDRIFGTSVGVCSTDKERVVFLTENGLHIFDGSGVKPTCQNLKIQPKPEGQVCVHAEFDGKYYLTYQVTNFIRKSIVLDVETQIGYYVFSSDHLGTCNGTVLCVAFDVLQRVAQRGAQYPDALSRFYVKETDFGVRGRKGLKSLYLTGEGVVTVRVQGVGRRTNMTISLSSTPTKMRLDLIGETFALEFLLEEEGRITGMEAEIEKLEGNVRGGNGA